MDNKQRVLASLSHERVGQIPFDIFEGWMWPGITASMVRELHAKDYEDLLDKLGVCCRWVTPMYRGPTLPLGAKDRIASPHTTHSLNAAIWGLEPGLREHGLGTAGHPLAQAQSRQDILQHAWPSPDWFDYAELRENARKHKNHFVIAGGFSPLFYLLSDLCGMEKTLMDLLLNPELIEALVGRIVEFYKDYFARIAKMCKGTVDAIAFGDDFSGQKAILMSPEIWRRYFKRAWAELFGIAKENGYKVFFHSCGSVFEIISDLIEIGLDVLYPIQPKAKLMDIATLKDRFGDSLSFYGGVDVQELLPFGKPEEIKEEVRRMQWLFSDSGGYILSTSHVIMDEIPVENALALYEQVRGGRVWCSKQMT